MGISQVTVEIASPARPAKAVALEFIVDSGAVYSVVPARVLKKLGIKALAVETFTLANGAKVRRRKGVALFKYAGRVGGTDVIFGEKDDSTLLGALTLEALGLTLDPLKRQLKPMPLLIAGWGSASPLTESLPPVATAP